MGKTIYRSYKMGGMWDLSILKNENGTQIESLPVAQCS